MKFPDNVLHLVWQILQQHLFVLCQRSVFLEFLDKRERRVDRNLRCHITFLPHRLSPCLTYYRHIFLSTCLQVPKRRPHPQAHDDHVVPVPV